MEALVFLAREGRIDIRSQLSRVNNESDCADRCETKGSCQAAAAGKLRLVGRGS